MFQEFALTHARRATDVQVLVPFGSRETKISVSTGYVAENEIVAGRGAHESFYVTMCRLSSANSAVPLRSRKWPIDRQREALEAILLHSKLKRLLAALGNRCYFLPDTKIINRTSSFDPAAGLVACFHVVAANHELSIAIHDEVRIVTSENKLALALRFPYLLNDVGYQFTVGVIFRLVDYKRGSVLIQEHCKKCGGLLACGSDGEVYVLVGFLTGAVLKNGIESKLRHRQ